MYLRFRLNGSSSSNGLSVALQPVPMYYITNNTGCPSLFRLKYNEFGSIALSPPGRTVSNRMTCDVLIDSGDDEKCVQLAFFAFYTESYVDYARLYDGNMTASVPLAVLSGSISTPRM